MKVAIRDRDWRNQCDDHRARAKPRHRACRPGHLSPERALTLVLKELAIQMKVGVRIWQAKKGKTRKAYVVRYRDADKKIRQKTFKTKKSAEEWAAQTKIDLKKGIHQPDSTSRTVSEAGELWLKDCADEGLEPQTIRFYRRHLKCHINPATAPEVRPNAWKGAFGNLKLSLLTGPVCEAFRLRVLKSPVRKKVGEIRFISRNTGKGVWGSFKRMLNVAVKHGLIAYNPAQAIRLDTKKREKVRIRIGEQIPDRPEVRDIIAASTGVWRVLFSSASFAGLRSSEIRALSWENVNLDQGKIEVVCRADWPGCIGLCKSLAAKREIQIPDEFVNSLRDWKKICAPSPEGLVFPDDDGNIIPGNKILRELYNIQHRLDIVHPNRKPKYTLHSLRHFYASIMIHEGTEPKRLQELLGHATITMTMDTYGHLFPAGEAEKKRANRAFAAVFKNDTEAKDTPSNPL
jgi:integrase